MVIALFALSLAMMVGGIAAMVQGFPYVRLESGLVMVIGGATAASAGAVLLGIGMAVGQLRRIAALLAERGAGLAAEPGLAATLRAAAFDTSPEPPPFAVEPRPTLVAGAAGLAGVSLAAEGFARGRRPAIEPAFGAPPEPAATVAEPLLPDLLPEPEPAAPEEDLFAAEEIAPPGREPVRGPAEEPAHDPGPAAPGQESLALRPALDEPESAPQRPEPPAPEPEARPPRIVGTHSSGANTYVMYSDGTIEADTPQGHLTFRSLDELKAYIDSGGETTRGAA